jgi:hypothetical protein
MKPVLNVGRNLDLKNRSMKFWPDLSSYEYESEVGSFEHGNKHLGNTNLEKFLTSRLAASHAVVYVRFAWINRVIMQIQLFPVLRKPTCFWLQQLVSDHVG